MPTDRRRHLRTDLIKQYGLWGCHPVYTYANWIHIPRSGTRMDYWDWVLKQLEKENNHDGKKRRSGDA